MRKINGRDPIDSFQRQSAANRRKAPNKKCKCGENRPLALIPKSKPVICISCDRMNKGRSPLDDHHPAGEANHSATVPIPVNDHRAVLSDAQWDWPDATWKNPSGSPGLAVAASLRGYCETNDYLTSQLLLRNALFLEKLEPFLVERLGANWWRGTELEAFAPKRKPRR